MASLVNIWISGCISAKERVLSRRLSIVNVSGSRLVGGGSESSGRRLIGG